jgi:hypothetical protein
MMFSRWLDFYRYLHYCTLEKGGKCIVKTREIVWRNDLTGKGAMRVISELLGFFNTDNGEKVILYVEGTEGDSGIAMTFYDLVRRTHLFIKTVAVGDIGGAWLFVFMAGNEREISKEASISPRLGAMDEDTQMRLANIIAGRSSGRLTVTEALQLPAKLLSFRAIERGIAHAFYGE